MKYSAELGKDINRLLEQARGLRQEGVNFTTQKVLTYSDIFVDSKKLDWDNGYI